MANYATLKAAIAAAIKTNGVQAITGAVLQQQLLGMVDTLTSGGYQFGNSKVSILRCLAFYRVQLSHLCMTIGKTIALTRWTFVSKVMSLLFNTLSRFVTAFLPSSKHLLILWLQESGSQAISSGGNKKPFSRKPTKLYRPLGDWQSVRAISQITWD